jgi:hypothetical protein
MTRASLHRRAALAGAALLTVCACRAADLSAPSSTLTPESASALRGGPAPSGTRKTPKPVACDPRPAASVSDVIGPRGGVLRFGASRLIVPAGALHEKVRITATTRGDASATVDFQPDGLRFHKPAGLVLDADGCDTPADGVPSVVHLGADGQVLETIAATFDRRWKEVAAPIVHFSGYAIAF